MPIQTEDASAVVVVIDDDEFVRESLDGLFRSVGYETELYPSVQEYLAAGTLRADCLVLDVRLPGQSGLDLQELLNRSDARQPVIFISGHADVAMSVRAMKGGAVEFLTKPVREQDLLDAVGQAVELGKNRRRGAKELADVRANYETLSPREREIMAEVVTGRRNKQIAADLGVTEATIKLHRGNIMQKMRARSLVELVRRADALAAMTTSTKG
jgi:FixJ family two-component response regulator